MKTVTSAIKMDLLQKLRLSSTNIIILLISSSGCLQAQHMEVSGNTLTIPIEPTHVGAITDDGTTALDGAQSIYVSGKYAYVASSSDDGVEILDISDPTNPTHVGAITDDGTTALNGAYSIYVSGKYAYVASNIDNGVEILDISDPTNPTHVGAITDDGTTALLEARSIHVSGKYAYVASSSGVEILDISDPTNPTHVGAIFDDGSTIALDEVQSIYVSGKYAYVTSDIDDGVGILDISDPTNPTHVGGITDDGTTALRGARSIYVSGKYAYVASSFDDGVEILDISEPTNPTHVGAITDDGTTALDGAQSIHVSGKYAYVTSSGDDGVEILDISDPTNPTHVGAITDDGTTALGGAFSIYVSGKYAYVASRFDSGVEILDISGIHAPSGHIGALAVSTLDISEKAQVGDDLHVGGSINVGQKGLHSTGSISTSGGLHVNDRVGIGTRTPDQLLTISDPDMPVLRFDRSGVGTWDWELYSASGGGLHFRGGGNNVGTALTDLVTFENNGDVVVKGIVTAMGTPGPSDIRYKKDVRNLEHSLDKIRQLRGVSYDWRHEEFPDKNFTKRRQQGFIAQEIEDIFPSMVHTDGSGYKAVEYAKVTPVLVEAVKELIRINEAQQDKIDYLEEQLGSIDQLKQEIDAIKNMVTTENTTIIKSF